jgi:hypothetical protein
MSTYSHENNSLTFKRKAGHETYSSHDNSLSFKHRSPERVKRAGGGMVFNGLAAPQLKPAPGYSPGPSQPLGMVGTDAASRPPMRASGGAVNAPMAPQLPSSSPGINPRTSSNLPV